MAFWCHACFCSEDCASDKYLGTHSKPMGQARGAWCIQLCLHDRTGHLISQCLAGRCDVSCDFSPDIQGTSPVISYHLGYVPTSHNSPLVLVNGLPSGSVSLTLCLTAWPARQVPGDNPLRRTYFGWSWRLVAHGQTLCDWDLFRSQWSSTLHGPCDCIPCSHVVIVLRSRKNCGQKGHAAAGYVSLMAHLVMSVC